MAKVSGTALPPPPASSWSPIGSAWIAVIATVLDDVRDMGAAGEIVDGLVQLQHRADGEGAELRWTAL